MVRVELRRLPDGRVAAYVRHGRRRRRVVLGADLSAWMAKLASSTTQPLAVLRLVAQVVRPAAFGSPVVPRAGPAVGSLCPNAP
jgi:hypothetical protein